MLNVLRERFKQGKLLKLILLGVGVSLVAFLGSYFVDSGGAAGSRDWIARVNDAQIPEWQFRQEARRLDDRYSGMFGDSYEQIKPQLQIRRQALEALVGQELIRQDARRMGLEPSRAEIAKQIRAHPDLRDASGTFVGADRYKQLLQRYPGGHTAFERQLADDLLQAKWTGFVTQPVTVEDGDLRDAFRRRTEKTAIDYVLFAAADQQVDGDLDEATLRGWYDEHLDDYRREAGRNIRYVVIDRDSQLEKIEISAQQLQAHYEANQATYTHPEQRRARHILLRVDSEENKSAVRDQAEGLMERLRAGDDFATLASEFSGDLVSAQRGGDLDFFGRDQMLDSFEQAAFSTPLGELAPLTETIHGFHVIEVTDSRQAGVAPLAEVEEDIRRLLRFRAVDTRLQDEADRVRAAIGDAARLEQAATAEGLEVQTAFYNRSEPIPGLVPSADFAVAVEALDVGVLSAPLRVGADMALVVVDELLPPAPAPFEEVEQSVRTAVVDTRSRAAAADAARRARQKHGSLAAIAKAVGGELQSSGDLAPGKAPAGIGGINAEFRAALFGDAVSEGQAGVIQVPAGAIVYEVTRREPFDPTRFESEKGALREDLLRERRSSYAQSVLNQLRAREEVVVNPDWRGTLDSSG